MSSAAPGVAWRLLVLDDDLQPSGRNGIYALGADVENQAAQRFALRPVCASLCGLFRFLKLLIQPIKS